MDTLLRRSMPQNARDMHYVDALVGDTTVDILTALQLLVYWQFINLYASFAAQPGKYYVEVAFVAS